MIDGQVGNRFARTPLIEHLNSCEGKTLGALDVCCAFKKAQGNSKVTGIAGDVIEQSVLFLKPNPKQEPDIAIDEVPYEVKTTGLRRGKSPDGEFEAKEPMSITAVSPNAIVGEDYWKSAFWHKIEHLLLFYYLYDSKRKVDASDYANFPLLSYQFHEYEDFTEEEQKTLERDWTKVRNFITRLQESYPDNYESQYPRISHDLRKTLMLIDTAPKWPNKPRFRFKRTFVTSIYQRHVNERRRKPLERLPDRYVEPRDIEEKCEQLTQRYKGKTVSELCRILGCEESKSLKSIAEPIIVRMFGGTKKKMCDIELFNKIGLLGKSIVLTERGTRTEDAKFFSIDFDEFERTDVDFEESQFYEFFSTCRILFVVFKEPSEEAPLTENRFVGFKTLTFDDTFIREEVEPVWCRIRELVQTKTLVDVPKYNKRGCRVRNKNGELSSAPNFPKSSEGVVFVRGTGNDSKDKREMVNGIKMYYQQVWIKGSYLADMLNDTLLA